MLSTFASLLKKTLKTFDYTNKAVNKLKIQSEVLIHYLNNSNIFKSLETHSSQTRSSFNDHIILLIKSIAAT